MWHYVTEGEGGQKVLKKVWHNFWMAPWRNLVNFSLLTMELTRLMLTHEINSACDFGQLHDWIANIYGLPLERVKQSTSGKRRYQLRSLLSSTKKRIYFGPLTKKVYAVNVSHTKNEQCACSVDKSYLQSDLHGRAAARWVLPRISSYLSYCNSIAWDRL